MLAVSCHTGGQEYGSGQVSLLKVEALRALIDQAFRVPQEPTSAELAAEDPLTGLPRTLHLSVTPYQQERGGARPETVLVVIQDLTAQAQIRQTLEQELQRSLADLERVRQEAAEAVAQREGLLEVLRASNRQFSENNYELTRTVEDLHITSQQFQVRTEEAQAVSEEAETLNEELQATNEELATLNEENQATSVRASSLRIASTSTSRRSRLRRVEGQNTCQRSWRARCAASSCFRVSSCFRCRLAALRQRSPQVNGPFREGGERV